MQTFRRRMALLEELRKRRMPVSVQELCLVLLGEGLLPPDLSDRSRHRLVQRDLQFLFDDEDDPGNPFGLHVENGAGRTRLWGLDPMRRSGFDFERLPLALAYALILLQKRVRVMLPEGTASSLAPLFDAAAHRLIRHTRTVLPTFHERLGRSVGFYQRGQSLQPPRFDTTQLDLVYQAILHGRLLRFVYDERVYLVKAYGVAFLLPKIYLVARRAEDDAWRHFLISRIERAELMLDQYEIAADFDLDQYVASGAMELAIGEPARQGERVVLRIASATASTRLLRDLTEFPVAPDQCIEYDADGRVRVSFTARRTWPLRNWLLGLAGEVEVLQPAAVRNDVLLAVKDIAARYGFSIAARVWEDIPGPGGQSSG